jgi:hypothetical protein
LLTGLACLATDAGIGYLAGEAALTQSAEGRLTPLRELKRRDWRSLLTGEDRPLRSQSRFLIENPDTFVTQLEASGLPASTGDQIRALGTTILYMPNGSEGVEQAFRNKTGLARYRDFRGVEVISSFGPVEVAGLRWASASKQDVSEAFAPEIRLKRDLLMAWVQSLIWQSQSSVFALV